MHADSVNSLCSCLSPLFIQLDHPNIIRPLELFERKRQLYFVMELCSGGDLFEWCPYSERDAARIVNQLVSAVRYLHSQDTCHRDLKCVRLCECMCLAVSLCA